MVALPVVSPLRKRSYACARMLAVTSPKRTACRVPSAVVPELPSELVTQVLCGLWRQCLLAPLAAAVSTVWALASKAVPATLSAGEVPRPWRAPQSLWMFICSRPATLTYYNNVWSLNELVETALGKSSVAIDGCDMSLSQHDIRVTLDMAPSYPKVRPSPPRPVPLRHTHPAPPSLSVCGVCGARAERLAVRHNAHHAVRARHAHPLEPARRRKRRHHPDPAVLLPPATARRVWCERRQPCGPVLP